MSAFTKGSNTWCNEHCDHGCRGACMAKAGKSDHHLRYNVHAVHQVNAKVRRCWAGGTQS